MSAVVEYPAGVKRLKVNFYALSGKLTKWLNSDFEVQFTTSKTISIFPFRLGEQHIIH